MDDDKYEIRKVLDSPLHPSFPLSLPPTVLGIKLRALHLLGPVKHFILKLDQCLIGKSGWNCRNCWGAGAVETTLIYMDVSVENPRVGIYPSLELGEIESPYLR